MPAPLSSPVVEDETQAIYTPVPSFIDKHAPNDRTIYV